MPGKDADASVKTVCRRSRVFSFRPSGIYHLLKYGLVIRLRLLYIPRLGDAVFFKLRAAVLCPTGTSIPLLLRTRRRTRVAVPRNRGCEAVPPPASSAPPPIAWLRCPLCATANGEFVRVQIIRLRGKYPKKQLF